MGTHRGIDSKLRPRGGDFDMRHSLRLRMRVKRVLFCKVLTSLSSLMLFLSEIAQDGKLFLVCHHNRTREVCLPAPAAADASGDVARLEMAIRQRFSDLSTLTTTKPVDYSGMCLIFNKYKYSARPFVLVGSDFCSWHYR